MQPYVFVIFLCLSSALQALDLPDAEQRALESDPQLEALRARATAFGHLATADAQLPDPQLRLGAQSLPLPSFDVRDEPMMQFQVGLEQRVPARSERRAARKVQQARQESLAFEIAARALAVRAAVRLEWIQIVGVQSLIELTGERSEVLARYSQALNDGVQNGRVSQQALLEGRARELRVKGTITQLRAQLAERRAQLASWLPAQDLPQTLITSGLPVPVDFDLADHPAVLAANSEALVAEAEIASARSAFDPGWSWSLGIGRRIGSVPAGAPDDTLLNASVRFELPLFTRDRQSRRLAAAEAFHRAALNAPVDARRALAADLERARTRALLFADLARSYIDEILPPAREAVEAARDKYRNGTIPLEDVLAAEVEVLDIRHELIEAQLEADRARVELAYLGGV